MVVQQWLDDQVILYYMAKYYVLHGQVLRITWQSNIIILCKVYIVLTHYTK